MKVAFDEHVPQEMVEVFRTLAEKGHVLANEFCSARDYVLEEDNGDDGPWMKRFADEGGKIVITGDIRIRSHLHQQKAYMDCGLALFMFPPTWNQWKLMDKCAFLMKWWNRIEKHAETMEFPSCWQIPAAWQGGELKDVTGPLKPKAG